MKLYNIILILGVLFLGLAACSEDKMDEIGENPNNPKEVPINLLISQSTLTTAFEIAGTDLAWYSSVFCEHTVGVHGQLEAADKRTGINSSVGNNNWNSLYATTLKDLSIIVERGSEGGAEEGNWAAVGIAKVMMAYCYSVATDLWGEVPFDEALQAPENRFPAFNSQQEVYTGILNLLDEGISDLAKENKGIDIGANDMYYPPDPAAAWAPEPWIKAANALKARFENRLSNIDPSGSADRALLAIQQAFEGPGDDMIFRSFNTDATGENPWFQEKADRGHHAISKTVDDILVSLNDPRRTLWFALMDGEIRPAPPGVAETDQGGVLYSRPTTTYLRADSHLPIITYDEVMFIKAEAHLRKSQPDLAYAAYLDGIRAALDRADVDPEDRDAYLDQGNIAVGADKLTLEHVITQKYVAFWMFQPIEAYNDYRRTGIPELQNPIPPFPNRFPYPNDEVGANPNVPDDVSFRDKVWWAK